VSGSLGTGFRLGLALVGLLVLSVAPGRAALASSLRAYPRLEVFGAGLLRDLVSLLPPLAGLALLLLVAGSLRASPRGRLARHLVRGAAILAAPLWLFAGGAAEFRIQRGLDPSWFDFQLAIGDFDFVRSSLQVAFYRRHWIPSSLCLAGLIALLVVARRFWRAPAEPADARFAAGFASATCGAYALAALALHPGARLFRSLPDVSVVGASFTTFFAPLSSRPGNAMLGVATLIERAEERPGSHADGAALLGLPAPPPSGVFEPHPFARSLSFDGPERALATGAVAAEPARAAELLAALDRLSLAIFEQPREPVVVWQVMLEGFRADDVRALNPSASPEVTPFVNRLYERAASGDGVIASKSTWQAGVRTAQALAALLCGLGTLPYTLALGRDLGPLPLRCSSDLLVDSGFEAAFYYGGRTSFDNMDGFLRRQGFSRITGRWQLPAGLPSIFVGVTDRALVQAALEEARDAAADRARTIVVMSVTNHLPYDSPPDLPPIVAERAQLAAARLSSSAQPDDRARLATLSYSDYAVEELYRGLEASPLGARSILLVLGDHSTSDAFLWPLGPSEAAHARVPFAIVLPPAFVRASASPVAVVARAREVDVELARLPLSQNDIPALLLALLARSPELASLPRDRRWHSMGGMTTSPWFSAPRREAVLLGVNSRSELFFIGPDSNRVGPLCPTPSIARAEDLEAGCSELRPVRSLLTWFLRSARSR
jgi:hypothetical protein